MSKRNTRTVATTVVAVQSVAAVAAPAVHITQAVVGLAKPYNVRAGTAQDNVRSWQAIVAYLQANGGTCTVRALAAHLQADYNHASFAAYCVRRGYLGTPVAPPVTACLGL